MKRLSKIFTTLCIVLFAVTSVSAQTYELGWSELNQHVQPAESYTLDWDDAILHVERAPVLHEEPQRLAAHPGVASDVPEEPDAGKTRVPWPETSAVDIAVSADQYYDFYAQRYKLVEFVEVTLYRADGRTWYETYENRGRLRTYEFFLNDLTPGDGYKATVVWDDGSNQTVERQISRNSSTSVWVDEPNHSAYSYWTD